MFASYTTEPLFSSKNAMQWCQVFFFCFFLNLLDALILQYCLWTRENR